MLCLSSQNLVFDNHMYFYQGVSGGRLCVLKCKINKNKYLLCLRSLSFIQCEHVNTCRAVSPNCKCVLFKYWMLL